MNNSKAFDKLAAIVGKVRQSTGRAEMTGLSADDGLVRTLCFDSLDLAELAVRIEAEFGVDVFDRGIPETVGDIVRRLES